MKTQSTLPAYTRDTVTVASGAGRLAPGTVLGKITTGGKFTVLTPGASNGSQTAAGILWGSAHATDADAPAVAQQIQPLTLEGWQVWDLVGRLGGQLHIAPGAVIGWDMSAGLSLGHALGIAPLAIAELLPALEAVMVMKVNEVLAADADPGVRP